MTSPMMSRNAGTTTAWKIDPSHSSVEFAVRHLVIATTKGRFTKLDGAVHLDDKEPAQSRVEAVIDAASITTADDTRDAHLRSADFLDVTNHPTLAFASRTIEPRGDGRYAMRGDLTIRGVTREVTLDVQFEGETTDPWGNRRAVATAEGAIDRRDFGLTWNKALEAGGWLVGDRVKISLAIEAVRQ